MVEKKYVEELILENTGIGKCLTVEVFFGEHRETIFVSLKGFSANGSSINAGLILTPKDYFLFTEAIKKAYLNYLKLTKK